ncbi:MAG: PD40 domain-containing protein [Melioribacteraceae bacterium]|nr:PD40 domain-containing protein [Melioribacteraceae bacterium]
MIFLFLFESISAQIFFFGRNKVQYDDFDWQILKTEHFDVYYYPEFEEIAEIGAAFAEETYDDLKVKFNHIITRRIPLIFYNSHIHFQQTNTIPGFIPEGVGGFFEFMKGRVVIPYIGSIKKFRHVINHELVHVFMRSKVYNVQRDHRSLDPKLPPLWFTEGIAEFWSTKWDTKAEMIMRDAMINNIFFPLKYIYQINGTFLMYKEGQNFLEFVKEEYGEEKILLMMENFWRFHKFSEVIEFTLGESITKIDEKWTFHLKQKYYPLMKNKYPHHISANKLTTKGFNLSPRYYKTASEESLYYIGNVDGYASIYKIDLLDKDEDGKYDPEIILRGEKETVFEKFHLPDASIDINDEKILAFVTKSGSSDVLHLYSLVSEEIVNSFQYNNLINIRSPKFSSDGKSLLFNASDRKGYSDLFILDLEKFNLQRLTNDYFDDKEAIWGKNDQSIVFVSDRTNGQFSQKYNLFTYDLSKNSIDYLTYTGADFSSPHFTPDFSELYANCDYDGTFNIWKIEKDDLGNYNGITQYTHFVTSVFDFTFVDSSKIITSGFENFSFQFYLLDLENIPDTNKHYLAFKQEPVKHNWEINSLAKMGPVSSGSYGKSYTLDYAYTQLITDPLYGTRGGGMLALSDMMGDDQFLFFLYNTAQISSDVMSHFNFLVSRINRKHRINYSYGLFRYIGDRYDIRVSNSRYYEESYGGFVSLLYPLSTFSRIETGMSMAYSERDVDYNYEGRKAVLMSNTLSYVHDNSLWLGTGPIDGTRIRLLVGYTKDIQYNNAQYYSFIADYRKYFRIAERSAIATRAALFINEGKEARRFIAGGSWDLRGWRRWSLRGEKLWLSSVELRFPLIDQLQIKFPWLGLGFPGIRGALYFDAGGVWNDEYEETLGSVGMGIRFSIFRGFVLRYDIGKKIEDNFSKFQNSLFYQFFIGWDF